MMGGLVPEDENPGKLSRRRYHRSAGGRAETVIGGQSRI
jgi:hypothetical protein